MTAHTHPHRFHDLSRRSLLGGSAALAIGGTLTVGSGMLPGGPNGLMPAAHAVEPPPRNVKAGAKAPGSVKGSTVTRLGNVTGPGVTTDVAMERTDIGIPARCPDGRTLVVFGDSYASWYKPHQKQMSPTGLYAEPDQPADQALSWSGAVGGDTAQQMLPEYRPEYSTKLPSDVITIGDTMYMQVWILKGWCNLDHTAVWKSSDNGATWEWTGAHWQKDEAEANNWLWTWDLHDDGYVYIYTSKYRGSPLYMRRVPHDRIGDKNAYETWGWTKENGWKWGQEPSPILTADTHDKAGNLIKDGFGFGESSLRRFGDQWMFCSVINGKLQAYLLDEPWADLHAAKPVTLLEGAAYEEESATRMTSLYLGGIVPGGTVDDFQMLVSQWVRAHEKVAPGGWPYWVENFRFQNFF
ncbi:DUF4185 domain-containing protein [Brachybacterium timonense]|uniref:DUF4185 domain-containing protein n=1 Tax=Brachybacterium timonense TaxID=2050896 RepID=UPI001482209D|nr:DUF4185 domain-containing protein [Brachybacterium timonense]